MCIRDRLLTRKAGEILVGGERIDGRRGYCGYMPQRDLLFPWRTVRDNLCLPMEVRGDVSRAEMDRRAEETLAHVGLSGWGDKRPDELSGGMRPVSYTHLDVYKRQVRYTPHTRYPAHSCLPAKTEAQFFLWKLYFKEQTCALRLPVSYTHLDVYKRQIFSFFSL